MKHAPHKPHARRLLPAQASVQTTAEVDGALLRDIRLDIGLTQQDFAKELGVTSNTMSRYERGYRAPPNTIMRLARELYRKMLRIRQGQDFLRGS